MPAAIFIGPLDRFFGKFDTMMLISSRERLSAMADRDDA